MRLRLAYNLVLETMLVVCLPTLPCPVLQFDTLAGFSAVIDRLGESCSLHTMATQQTGRHRDVGCLSLCCCVSTLTRTPCLHRAAEAQIEGLPGQALPEISVATVVAITHSCFCCPIPVPAAAIVQVSSRRWLTPSCATPTPVCRSSGLQQPTWQQQ